MVNLIGEESFNTNSSNGGFKSAWKSDFITTLENDIKENPNKCWSISINESLLSYVGNSKTPIKSLHNLIYGYFGKGNFHLNTKEGVIKVRNVKQQ